MQQTESSSFVHRLHNPRNHMQNEIPCCVLVPWRKCLDFTFKHISPSACCNYDPTCLPLVIRPQTQEEKSDSLSIMSGGKSHKAQIRLKSFMYENHSACFIQLTHIRLERGKYVKYLPLDACTLRAMVIICTKIFNIRKFYVRFTQCICVFR